MVTGDQRICGGLIRWMSSVEGDRCMREMEGIDYGKTDRKPNELGDVRCERGQMSRLQSCADKHLTIGKQIAVLLEYCDSQGILRE